MEKKSDKNSGKNRLLVLQNHKELEAFWKIEVHLFSV